MKNKPLTEKEIRMQHEAQQAYLMVLQGFSYAEIGATLQIPKTTAHERVKSVLLDNQEAALATLRDMRSIELARMDDLYKKAYEGERNAVDVYDNETGALVRDGSKAKILFMNQMVQISKHRSALLNLFDIPEAQVTEATELDSIDVTEADSDDLLLLLSSQARDQNE